MFLPRNLFRSVKGFGKYAINPVQTYKFSTASPLSKEKNQIDEKIKKNINQKISLLQFKSLKEDILSSKDQGYLNSEVLRLIILKSIQKANIKFASEIFDEMTSKNIIPDDVSYSTLIEGLIVDEYVDEAYELYINAYLNKVTLDLEIFYSLMEGLEKKDFTYTEMGYKILTSTLIPSKLIMEQMIYLANKAKSTEFMESLFEDLEKYGIDKIDPPKPIKEKKEKKEEKEEEEEEREKKPRRGRKKHFRGSGSSSPVVIFPFDSKPGQKGWGKGDHLAFIEELMNMSGNKWADDEYGTDESEMDSDEDGFREDYTSESDNEK